MLAAYILTVLGAWLGYANPWLHLPVAALGLPAGLTAIALCASSRRQAFRQAWQAASLACVGCLYWVYWPVYRYGELHWLLAVPMPVLLSMVVALYFALFAFVVRLASERLRPLRLWLCIGLSWTLMELLAAWLFTGFPWLTLAGAFVPWPFAVQGASVVGAYGLSGLLALVAAGPALKSRGKLPVLASLVLAAVLAAFGLWRVRSLEDAGPEHVVAIAQGNIDQSVKWDPAFQASTVERYIDLSRQSLSRAKPELIVWPETATPFYFQDDTPLRGPVLAFARNANATLLIGSPAYERAMGDSYTLFNRAFVLRGENGAMDWYDKEHLVPFGEYMPLGEWIPLQKLVQGVGDFAPGHALRPLMAGDLALGVLVCYEAIFAGLAQDRVSQGAEVLVNISNDAWFGATSAPIQHMHLAALRAVEQGRWLVRSTNTGISAFIDPLGRIHRAGPQFEPLSAEMAIRSRTARTPFSLLYPYLLWGVFGMAALFALRIALGTTKSPH